MLPQKPKPSMDLPSSQNLNQRDLSQRSGNSTSGLQAAYQQLMSIQDPAQLRQAALQVVAPMLGKGISQKNLQTFKLTLQKIGDDLVKLQSYITNYILKGSGLGVMENEIAAIESLITEDVREVKLTDDQWRWKRLVESYGYHVGKAPVRRIDG